MRYFYILLLSIVVASCASPYYEVFEVHTPCDKYTDNYIFDKLRKVLIREDFVVTDLDYSVGLMVAESEPEFGNHAYRSYRKQWKFMIDGNGTIVAKARIIETHTNDHGLIVYEQSYYMGENTHPENYWYWGVRNAMENICGNSSQSFSFNRASAVVGENEELTASFILGITSVAIQAAIEANDD